MGSIFERFLVDFGVPNRAKLAPKVEPKLALTSKGVFPKKQLVMCLGDRPQTCIQTTVPLPSASTVVWELMMHN